MCWILDSQIQEGWILAFGRLPQGARACLKQCPQIECQEVPTCTGRAEEREYSNEIEKKHSQKGNRSQKMQSNQCQGW